MVEQKPSKLTTRVRFPSPAPVSADISPLEQTPERVLRIPLECHRTFGAKPLATRWLVPLGGLVLPVVGGFLFGDASTMLSASLMGDPVMLLLFGMLMLLVVCCLFMAIWQPLRSGWTLEQAERGARLFREVWLGKRILHS